MISTTVSFVSTDKMTDRSVVSACSLGFSSSAFLGNGLPGTGLSGAGLAAASLRPAADLAGLPVMERDERPTKALEAGVAAGKASAYVFAATGAGTQTKQTQQHHHTMWAFRGLEPWSDPA
ncbi:hypothetical protein ACGFYP_25990 [Streptomyces sp. NPDC048370]|uniref:hypothetical protein n=2 Tax=unclassified Streptomyces TaxID=2593676 RepID=UPI003717A3E7